MSFWVQAQGSQKSPASNLATAQEKQRRDPQRHLTRAQCEPLDSTMPKLNAGNGNGKTKTKRKIQKNIQKKAHF